MQQLKYINPQEHEVVFGRIPPYLLESVKGIGPLDAQPETSDPAAIDGKILEDVSIGDREVTAKVHIHGSTRTLMYSNRMALIAIISPALHKGGKLGRLEYQNDFGRWWTPAMVKRGPQENDRSGNYNHASLIFYCPNSCWRGMTPAIDNMAYLNAGFEFPLNIDSVTGIQFGQQGYNAVIPNIGDSPSPIELTITGPATDPRITKISTGEYIQVRKQLYAGDILYINTTPGAKQVLITRANGLTEGAMGYLKLPPQLFQLDPGENELQYSSGDDTTSATVTVRIFPWYGGA